MHYVIKNEENKIVRAMDQLYIPLHLNENETLVPLEEETLRLPMEWYNINTRPEYVELLDVNSINLVGGVYNKNVIFKAEPIWNLETLDIKIKAFFTKHTIVDQDYLNIGPDDLADITLVEGPEAFHGEFSETKDVLVNGETVSVVFANGEGVIANYNYDEQQLNNPYILIDGAQLMFDPNWPESFVKMKALRYERDAKISKYDWLVIRHESQVVKTLTDVQYGELQTYLQALRDLPETVDLNNIVWPVAPEFI